MKDTDRIMENRSKGEKEYFFLHPMIGGIYAMASAFKQVTLAQELQWCHFLS